MWNQWQIDFYQVMYRLIGWIYRTPVFLALLRVNSQPMNYINGQFVAFRNAIAYKLKFNAQIVNLELFLNNLLSIANYAPATRDADIAAHRIVYIVSENSYPNYLWNEIEFKPKQILYNKSERPHPILYVGNASEYQASNSFIVNIPVAVAFNPIVVRAAINTYNLASKTFTIVTY